MSAPEVSASGSSPPESAQNEATSKKRHLDEDPVGLPATSAAAVEPGSKRRKTSKSPSASPTVTTNPTEASQIKQPTVVSPREPVANSQSQDAHESSLDLDHSDDMAQPKRNRAASAASENKDNSSNIPSMRVVTRSMAGNSSQSDSVPSNAQPPKSKGKKAKKQRDILEVKNQTFNMPTDPTLLDPASKGETWESKVARFKAAINSKNPKVDLSQKNLRLVFNRYIKVSAWLSDKQRTQKTLEATRAFAQLRKAGKLQELVEQAKPKDYWAYPETPMLLAPLSKDEGVEGKLRRLCAALLRENSDKRDLITTEELDVMISRWTRNYGFKGVRNAKSKRQEVTSEIETFKQTASYTQFLDQILEQTLGTEEDPVIIDDGGEEGADAGDEEGEEESSDDGEEDEEEDDDDDDAEDEEEENNEEGEDGAAIVAGQDSTASRPEAAEQPTRPVAAGSGPAPTASDWASLLEPATDADTLSVAHVAVKSGDAQVPGRVIMAENAVLEEQQKYFPGGPTSPAVCVVCACPGHALSACPSAKCKHCSGDHFSWGCPGRRRCTKCKQFGHRAAKCTEKLALTRAEGLACAFCDSPDHMEYDCNVIWRSFRILRPEDRKTVRSIPAFCGLCGSDGHFSDDCGLKGNRRTNMTWSSANRSQYVDGSSEQEAVSAHSKVPEPLGPGTQIKGLSAKRTHVFYSDSDGSEEGEFLGGRVQPKAAPGQIRMATNIQFTPVNTGFQGLPPPPPLPPGPPPSGPPPRGGGYSSLSRSHGLPPRPVAPGQPSFGLPQPPLPNYPPPPGLGMNGPGQPSNGRKRHNGPSGGAPNPNKRPRRGRGGKQG